MKFLAPGNPKHYDLKTLTIFPDCDTEGEVTVDGCKTCTCYEGHWSCYSYTCSGRVTDILSHDLTTFNHTFYIPHAWTLTSLLESRLIFQREACVIKIQFSFGTLNELRKTERILSFSNSFCMSPCGPITFVTRSLRDGPTTSGIITDQKFLL